MGEITVVYAFVSFRNEAMRLSRINEIGLLCAWKKLKHMIRMDADTMDLATRHGAYEYLLKYSYACDWKAKNWKPQKGDKIIWTCWWQGVENAPLLVQRCIQSMREHANGYEVKIIDQTNWQRYIQIPKYIFQKHEQGIIPHAHFADIIRLYLLLEYGGIWIDSTILLTDVLPDYIQDAPLFMYRSGGRGDTLMVNPFIAAFPHHPFLEDVLRLLLEYWKQENRLVAYIIMPLFCTMVVRKSPYYSELWEKTPPVSCAAIDILLPMMNKPFDPDYYHLIKQLSSVHKLTYKFSQYGIDTGQKGTFYDVLIKGNDAERNENTAL